MSKALKLTFTKKENIKFEKPELCKHQDWQNETDFQTRQWLIKAYKYFIYSMYMCKLYSFKIAEG